MSTTTTGDLDAGLLTIAESAHYLHVSQATVHRLMRAGQLPRVRLLGAVRLRRDDLDEIAARRTRR